MIIVPGFDLEIDKIFNLFVFGFYLPFKFIIINSGYFPGRLMSHFIEFF